MKRIDFENGTVTGNILGAALPMLAAQLLNLLYNICRPCIHCTYSACGNGSTRGSRDLFSVNHDHYCFCKSLRRRWCAAVFDLQRKKRREDSSQNYEYIVSMICASAVLLMIGGFLFAYPVLILFGASKDAMLYAYPYMMIYLIGTLPSMIAVGMNPFINAQGYSVIGMSSVAVGAAANLILDPVFIFYPWTRRKKGAAIATVLSQTISAIFCIFSSFQEEQN